jgi:hypothetical protein
VIEKLLQVKLQYDIVHRSAQASVPMKLSGPDYRHVSGFEPDNLFINIHVKHALIDEQQFNFPMIMPVNEKVVGSLGLKYFYRQKRVFICYFFIIKLHIILPQTPKSHKSIAI